MNPEIRELYSLIKDKIKEYNETGVTYEFHRHLFFKKRLYHIYFNIGRRLTTKPNIKYKQYPGDELYNRILGRMVKRTKSFTFVSPYNMEYYSIRIRIELIKENLVYINTSLDVNKKMQAIVKGIHQFIIDADDKGVSGSELYNRTRRILNKTERENIIFELISTDKIYVEKSGDAKKRMKVYYAK
jgi:hypothetical protein